MFRQLHIWASRASPAQKQRGLRVVLFQKLFQGNISCFLGDSFGRCIFEQYARETNLKKKRSVNLSSLEKTGPPLCIFCRELTMVLPVLHLVVIDSFLSTNSYKYRTSPWQTTLKSLIIMLLHVLFLLGNFFYLHCLYLHVYLFSDKIYQHVFSCTDCTHSNFDDREVGN